MERLTLSMFVLIFVLVAYVTGIISEMKHEQKESFVAQREYEKRMYNLAKEQGFNEVIIIKDSDLKNMEETK